MFAEYIPGDKDADTDTGSDGTNLRDTMNPTIDNCVRRASGIAQSSSI